MINKKKQLKIYIKNNDANGEKLYFEEDVIFDLYSIDKNNGFIQNNILINSIIMILSNPNKVINIKIIGQDGNSKDYKSNEFYTISLNTPFILYSLK